MKALLVLLLVAGAIASTPAGGQRSSASPLIGSWAVDVSRLPLPPEARPKSVTFNFGQTAGGKWTTQVDILGGDGSARHMTSAFIPDGTPARIEGDTAEADTVAVKMPAADVMVMALSKGGSPASTRIYAVLPDGRQMVETAVYFDANGKAIMRTNYFTRASRR